MIPFKPFNKIPRLNRLCTITEKIDGTNGIIHIEEVPLTPVEGAAKNNCHLSVLIAESRYKNEQANTE